MQYAERRWANKFGLAALLVILCALHAFAHDEAAHGHESSHEHKTVVNDWEGSPEGKAYSDFNHHLAGICVILIGISEIRYGFAASVLAWTRFLLPVFMVTVGVFLLIWSDHQGWPFGATFTDTFLTGEWETVQHKWFGVLALVIGSIEWLRRTGRLTQHGWRFPLPAFAIIGGLSLFLHSHGAHPSAHKIALHHAIMGILAVTAGSSKFVSDWAASRIGDGRSPWDLAWATLVLLIGVQLLIYSE